MREKGQLRKTCFVCVENNNNDDDNDNKQHQETEFTYIQRLWCDIVWCAGF